ncbi:MAG: hypothetical protein Q7I93_04655 [Syntrophales bacterium]|nr:hypothetical protein [Syntrophales bacterium]
MRSVFDQYKQPENQLTHALACALAEDPALLARFIKEVADMATPIIKHVQILEQQVPGEDSSYSEEETERRGLPDAWIHDGESWALLIESKVQAALTKDQLKRHYRVAERRGYTDINILVIGINRPQFDLPHTTFQAWTDIYKWLKKNQARSEWARRAAQYMEIWEGKMVAKDKAYLTDGAVTVFSGIPFGDEEPYNYSEAKRLLKLAMDDLQNRKDLEHDLGMNPDGERRGAITGKLGKSVWDLLPLKGLKTGEAFTKYPHLTLALEHDRVVVIMTIPSGIRPVFRRNIVRLGFAGFSDLMSKVNQNLNEALKGATGAAPWVIVLQRRYPSQRSAAITDAILQYDLRTAFPGSTNKQVVKTQSQWLTATYNALEDKKSNLQIAVGAIFPYKNCKAQKSPEILNYIADTWLACKPLLKVMIKD